MMVRDPRDIVKSMALVREKFISNGKRPPRFVRSVAASVQEINRYYDAGLTAAEKSKKILLVYYEDLVRNPSHEVQKVCDHIGLPYEAEMLNIENSILGTPKAADDENWSSKSGIQQPIRLKGVISGRKKLKPSEITLIERFTQAKPALDRYNIGQENPSLREIFLWRLNLARKACMFCPR